MLCIINSSMKHQTWVYVQSIEQTVLFQRPRFRISHLFVCSLNVKSSIWFMDMTLSVANSSGQSAMAMKWVLHIRQSSNITGASPSDCLVLWGLKPLQRGSRCILRPQPTGPYINCKRIIGRMGRVFANGLGDLGSIPGHVIPYLTTPPLGQDMTQGQLLSGV